MNRHLPIAPFLLVSGLAHASLWWVWQAGHEPSGSEGADVAWMNVSSRSSNGEALRAVDADAQSLAATHFSHLEEPLAQPEDEPEPPKQRASSAKLPAQNPKRKTEPVNWARVEPVKRAAVAAKPESQSQVNDSGRKAETGQTQNSVKPVLAQTPPLVERSSVQPSKGVFASLKSASSGASLAAGAQARGNSSKVGEAQDFGPLLAALRAKVEAGKRYPRLSRVRGEEGVAEISFQLKPNGSVESLAVMQSSSHPRLDREALRAVEQVEPFPMARDYLAEPKQFSIKLSFVLR